MHFAAAAAVAMMLLVPEEVAVTTDRKSDRPRNDPRIYVEALETGLLKLRDGGGDREREREKWMCRTSVKLLCNQIRMTYVSL